MTPDQAATVQAYASIASVFVTALGLVAIFIQIRTSSKGTRGQNSSVFLLGEHRQALFDAASRTLGERFDLLGKKQMSEEMAEQLLADPVADASLSSLLNHYETIAAGIHSGTLDEEVFRFAYMRRVRMLVWQLIHFLHVVRQEARNDKIYSELERLALRWDCWSDASPHFFRDGEVITGVPYHKLPTPSAEDMRRHKWLKP